MPDCGDFYPLIDAYVDDMLGEEDKKTLKEHLETCEQCRAILQMTQMMQQVTPYLEEDPPDELTDRILRATVHEKKRKFPIAWMRPFTLTAAVAAIALMIYSANPAEQLQTPKSDEQLRHGFTYSGDVNADGAVPEEGSRLDDSSMQDDANLKSQFPLGIPQNPEINGKPEGDSLPPSQNSAEPEAPADAPDLGSGEGGPPMTMSLYPPEGRLTSNVVPTEGDVPYALSEQESYKSYGVLDVNEEMLALLPAGEQLSESEYKLVLNDEEYAALMSVLVTNNLTLYSYTDSRNLASDAEENVVIVRVV